LGAISLDTACWPLDCALAQDGNKAAASATAKAMRVRARGHAGIIEAAVRN
jgi:hypothetical protein